MGPSQPTFGAEGKTPDNGNCSNVHARCARRTRTSFVSSYETLAPAFSARHMPPIFRSALNLRTDPDCPNHLAAPLAPSGRRRSSKKLGGNIVPPKMVTVPASWFTIPMQKSIAKSISPPTALMRRKETQVRAPLPLELFEEFMSPMLEGDVQGLVRRDGALQPTKTTKARQTWSYLIKKGSVSDRLFRQEAHNPKPGPTGSRSRTIFSARAARRNAV